MNGHLRAGPAWPGLLRSLLVCALLALGLAVLPAAPAHAAGDCRAYGETSVQGALAVKAACDEVAAGTMYSWGGGHGPVPGKTHGTPDGGGDEAWNDGNVVGFDCSGLTRWAWSVATGRDVLGPGTTSDVFDRYWPVRFGGGDGTAHLKPGDVLFWKASRVLVWMSTTHTAIYLGDGKIVEAAESQHPLQVADFSSHSSSIYVGAIRPSESSDSATPDNSGLPGQLFSTWGEWVRAGNEPRRGSTVQHTFPGPTQVKISCQIHGESITAEGITNDLWSYLPGYDAWITNIYVRGPAALPGVPDCLSGGPVGGGGSNGQFTTWGDGVNVRSQPTLTAAVRQTIGGETTVRVSCQQHGDTVNAEGLVNTVWSYLPDYNGWITNIYLKGPAVLPGIPDCAGGALGGGTTTAGCTDGGAPDGTGARSPRSVSIAGRLIELRYSDTTECAWGRITGGTSGDEVWVDRSLTGGQSWDQLGFTKITSGSDAFTTEWNDHNVVMRACGSPGDSDTVVCTDWF
ncbi:NlpC/P60 family protein [Streptomyces sp. NPDC048481]|uniref:NlpC/P60 family protein n=1 Tax=Streptomyces sp. NPDC048481 TaxID=3365557 RepID=UPI003710A464